jgi:hypothetical protein
MLFSWFNTAKVDAFVDEQIAELARRVPPGKLEGDAVDTEKARKALERAHDLMLRNARDFVQRERPNLYQKARIANRVKWAMREAKYPSVFVDEFAYEIASVVAAANSQREV